MVSYHLNQKYKHGKSEVVTARPVSLIYYNLKPLRTYIFKQLCSKLSCVHYSYNMIYLHFLRNDSELYLKCNAVLTVVLYFKLNSNYNLSKTQWYSLGFTETAAITGSAYCTGLIDNYKCGTGPKLKFKMYSHPIIPTAARSISNRISDLNPSLKTEYVSSLQPEK